MKLHKSLLLFGASLALLTACGSDEGTDTTEGAEEPETEKVEAEEEKAEETGELATVEQVPYSIELQEPDSSGQVYGIATFENNTEYPVVGFTLTVNLADTNDSTYYSTYDTVMPGETSSNFDSFGPNTGDENDMQVTLVEFNLQLEDGSTEYITYDTKLDSYDSFNAAAE